MTLDLFQQLSHEVQLYFMLTRSTFLAWRWRGQSPVMLYHLPTAGRGFFIELTVDAEQTYFIILRSFSDSEALEDYAQGVRLPGQSQI